MAITLPPLPFESNALEPFMSKRTLDFHHGKHHKKYVDTTNELIQGTAFENASLEAIMLASAAGGGKLFNNSAQAWNHGFFWNCLTPPDRGPSANLEKIIERNFGSLDAFKKEFTDKGKEQFGSGWAWLVKDTRGRLAVRALGNAGNPLVEDEVPLLTCDVWEHAYYLDYQNERPDYLENFWRIVNWEFVEANLDSAIPARDLLGEKRDGDEDARAPRGDF